MSYGRSVVPVDSENHPEVDMGGRKQGGSGSGSGSSLKRAFRRLRDSLEAHTDAASSSSEVAQGDTSNSSSKSNAPPPKPKSSEKYGSVGYPRSALVVDYFPRGKFLSQM